MSALIAVGDLSVNRLGFGAMRVCGPQVWGPPKDRPNALRVLKRAPCRVIIVSGPVREAARGTRRRKSIASAPS